MTTPKTGSAPQPDTPAPRAARGSVFRHPIPWLRAAPPWAITWLGIGAVIVAVALSVVADRPGSRLRDYDVQAAILAITAVSLFFTAQVTREATDYQRDRDAKERRERRRALAEAMITELTELRGQAEEWNDKIMSKELTFVVEFPVLAQALESASLFDLAAVRGLTKTLHQLAELRSAATNIREVLSLKRPEDDDARKDLANAAEMVVRSAVTDIRMLIVALTHERDNRLD